MEWSELLVSSSNVCFEHNFRCFLLIFSTFFRCFFWELTFWMAIGRERTRTVKPESIAHALRLIGWIAMYSSSVQMGTRCGSTTWANSRIIVTFSMESVQNRENFIHRLFTGVNVLGARFKRRGSSYSLRVLNDTFCTHAPPGLGFALMVTMLGRLG